jgi:hypothetical protein
MLRILQGHRRTVAHMSPRSPKHRVRTAAVAAWAAIAGAVGLATPVRADAPRVEPPTQYAMPGYYILRLSPIDEARPAGFNWEYRFHFFRNLRWSSWGPDGAQGAGTEFVQTSCDPDCASGPSFTNPVQIRASNPQAPAPITGCPADVRYYTDVVIVYPTTAPPQFEARDLQWTSENGRPAAHYIAHQPFCEN